MTITYVGAGTATTGNNSAVTPGAVTGIATGDLTLIAASIRNSGVGTVNTPTGWTKVAESGNAAVLARFRQTGDSLPSVTFTGGVANADTIARAVAFRGVAIELDRLTPVVQLNGSAQNVAYPAITLADRYAVLTMLWKQDDATAYSTPSGFTAIGMTSTTTGDDASQALFYEILTTGATIPLGSSTVTGGAAAISRGLMLAIKPAPAISAVEQDAFPPRVLVSVTGLDLGDDVSVYRVVAGQRTLVRDGSITQVTDPSFLRVDSELPFGVPVSYVAVINDQAEYATSATTYTLPGGDQAKLILSDAITGASAEAIVKAWDEKDYARRSSTFKVGGRNVVISGELGMFEASIELFFEAYSSGQNFKDLVATATEGVIQLRAPSVLYDGVSCYVAVTGARERRFSQDGSDGRRTWVIDVAEVEGWAPGLQAVGFTYGDVATFYGTGTYADAAGDYATYLAAEQGDYSP